MLYSIYFLKELSTPLLNSIDVSSSTLLLTWLEPNGYYDSIEINVILESTTSNKYFVDGNVSRPYCNVNTTYQEKNIKKTSNIPFNGNSATLVEKNTFYQLFTGVCPMSNFNATMRVIRAGFDSTEDYTLIRTCNYIIKL